MKPGGPFPINLLSLFHGAVKSSGDSRCGAIFVEPVLTDTKENTI